MNWTQRHEKSIDKLLRRERHVRIDKRNHELIQRLKAAMSYLRERKQNNPPCGHGG